MKPTKSQIEAIKAGREALKRKLDAGLRTCAEDLETENHIQQIDQFLRAVADKKNG